MGVQTEKTVDVAILGGGLAGNLFARHLRRHLPSLSVALFEKEERRSYKVGESSVEIASHYFVNRLGLSTYLYDEQLPKNGLRFFFDTPERDASLEQMSEVGSDHLPMWPTFQIDRARFELDLLRMNAQDGVDVRCPARVRDLKLREGDDARRLGHSFTVEDADGKREPWRARWVIDASGRTQLISRLRDLKVPEKHACGAVWGRFKNVVDLDAIQHDAWRGRVRHTSRVLSTNHFCYKGYWIWFIPIARGVTSVGFVGEPFRSEMRDEEGFLSFLREHAAVGELLEGAELLDVAAFARYSYATKQFWSGQERWACLGEAACFADPFYSPGSDYIAIEADMIAEMLRRDLVEEQPAREIAELGALYDEFMRFRYEATMKLYRDQYSVLGSYEVMRLKWNYDISCYYNLWLDPYVRGQHIDPRYLRSQLRRRDYILNALENFSRLFQHLVTELERRGEFHRNNVGQYNDGTDLLHFQAEIGRERKKGAVNARTEEIFNYCLREARRILGEDDGDQLELHQFMEPAPLA